MPRCNALLLAPILVLAALASPAPALTLDFEDLGANLPLADPDSGAPEYFYDGYSAHAAGQPTDFASGPAGFNNEFDDFGGGCCWQGWAYSQTTDTTTQGPQNQYSAYPGSGVGGSATYGVAYTGGAVGGQADVSRITFTSAVQVSGGWFTNTTWSALTMRDGDPPYSKKFGGSSGSDPDSFILTITGRDAADVATGSVDFVLADYRFSDDSLDYIVDEWTWVDLSGLGSVASLEFELASSDTASFGYLNTPAYFAMDDLVLVPEPGSGVLLALGLLALARRRS